jgi:uncharacterized protein YndB with AHSA1/START domain
MSEPAAERASTQVSMIIRAPRAVVYRACLDPDALAQWRVPDNMSGHVQVFDAREGGAFRMSLTYRNPEQSPGGKTSDHTDTFQGRFLELVPDETIVEVIAFETPDPRFAGEMTITTRLTDAAEGTNVTVLCRDLPPGIRPEDNELGTHQALQKLATLIE